MRASCAHCFLRRLCPARGLRIVRGAGLCTRLRAGCYFELGDQIDWDRVTTLEILTGPVLATGDDIGTPVPGQVELPFLQSALDLWDDLLNEGHRITAVSGPDSKGVEPDDDERQRRGYGSSATAVYAQDLSAPSRVSAAATS